MGNRVNEFLASLKGRLKQGFVRQQDAYDPVPHAQALIDSGIVGHEATDPRFDAFLQSLPANEGLSRSAAALELLAHAGSQPALKLRNSSVANLMGDRHFQDKAYLPCVIEYTLAYANGVDTFSHMADYVEGFEGARIDREGLAGAVSYLAKLPGGDPGIILLKYQLQKQWVPADSLCASWRDNPDLQQLLRSDFGMYRAAAQAAHGHNQEAYAIYTDAVGGISSRIDRNQWYRDIFAPRAANG